MANLTIPKDFSSDESNKYFSYACAKFEIKQHACWINATAYACLTWSGFLLELCLRELDKLQFQLQSETVVKMALQGVWQLKKLIVSYCDWGVSSQKRSSPRSFCAEAEAEALLVKQWISGLTFTCGYTVFAMLSTVSAIPVTRFKPGSKKT
ncbi:hypothetical protein V6N12_047691 [Hibiscus sabdariffa]|uniref:CASP-like protein n=1 Tax=Hibiscus sabdariffa TaxID=183260 RepID=A0ABR2CTQ1_9ROSI